MKVTLINHNDIRGGASMAALRILEALRAKGVDARMIVKNAEGPHREYIQAIGGGMRAKFAFLAERLRIFFNNGLNRSDLFKVSTADCGLSLRNHPWIMDADIVMLHWINQGMMSLDEIEAIAAMGKPIVWTMHDMWPMTGICHHAHSCTRYQSECGKCPFLGWPHLRHDLSTKVFRRKARLYERGSFHFVAVSKWLADKAAGSALLTNREIDVVHNAFPVKDYVIAPRRSRAELGLPDDGSRLVVFCASRIDDQIKNLPGAILALNRYDGDEAITAVFCGEIRHPEILEHLTVPYVTTGPIKDMSRLNDIYAHSAVVLSSSDFETLGGTLIEGMASGAVPVCFGGDGRAEIFKHLSSGYLARCRDVSDLASGIEWAIAVGPTRESLHNEALHRFDSSVIADRYIEIFNRILQSK